MKGREARYARSYSAAKTLVRYLRCLSLLWLILWAPKAEPCIGMPLEPLTMFSSSSPRSIPESLSGPFEGSFPALLLVSVSCLPNVASTWKILKRFSFIMVEAKKNSNQWPNFSNVQRFRSSATLSVIRDQTKAGFIISVIKHKIGNGSHVFKENLLEVISCSEFVLSLHVDW